MKPTRLVLIMATLAIVAIISACSKESSSSGNNTSARMTLITTSAWKFDTTGIDLDKNGTIDLADGIDNSCLKDNSYLFNKDSTGLGNNGTTKCDDAEPATFAFTWSFSGTDQSKITSTADPLLASGINIFSMTDTKFVLYKDTTISGANFWYILSLKH